MSLAAAETVGLAADALVLGLHQGGVREVVVSPGSRSTPLVVALERHGGLSLTTAIDERAAAFFALGQARLTGRPSVVVSTSGTAAAHHHPAILEADLVGAPLISLTADRPSDRVGAGAPQTLDQAHLFGRAPRAFVDLDLGDASERGLRALARSALRAIDASRYPDPGPVHLNVHADKPLEPRPAPPDHPSTRALTALAHEPSPLTPRPSVLPDPAAIDRLVELFARARRPLISIGPRPATAPRLAGLGELARRLSAVVRAEATSQLGFGGGLARAASADWLWQCPALRAAHLPDVVLELGGTPTQSGALELGGYGVARAIVAPARLRDPDDRAHVIVHGDEDAVVAALLGRGLEVRAPAWVEGWSSTDLRVRAIVDRAIERPGLGELATVRTALERLPDGATLVLGNSLVARHVDLALASRDRPLAVVHQRGAAGIDGIVAGGLGAASVASGPVLVLLGDVSLFHDLTSLALPARRPVVVLVVDNHGGRIFEQLPVAERFGGAPVFARFLTPPRLEIGLAARALGVDHARATTRAELARALDRGLERAGVTVLEAAVPEDDAARTRAEILAALAAELGGER